MSKGKLFKVSKLSVLLSLLSVGALAILLAAIVWTSPSIQDRLIKRMALERLHSGDNSALLTDNSLHILLCGTGSPMPDRSEEHTSELQSLMRISYAVFCLKKKTKRKK